MNYEQFSEAAQSITPVSHETFIRLQSYAALLNLWQPKINLVSQSTLPELWTRHFLDSVQLASYLPMQGPYMDFGSGGGFPGAVLAIVTGQPFTLVESDHRKGAFLLEVARVTQAPIKVLSQRIEALDPALPATAITARAFAPLDRLLPLAAPWLLKSVKGIFLKGRGVEAELTAAAKSWHIEQTTYLSLSDPDAAILVVSSLAPR